jgi:phospholipid/cholesterol/gamma-HCH transport system substrate-binding protein
MRHSTRRPYVVAVGLLVALALVCWFAFNPGVPFQSSYRVDAVFTSSNELRQGSPVRVAGVDVGKVAGIRRGPGETTVVTMEIAAHGRPVHSDAIARIRPRVFLEGGFRIELTQGSPGAPELPSGGVIPLAQTSTPVQMHQALTMFDSSARDRLRETFRTFAGGLADGGAQGLRQAVGELEPLLREGAVVADASQGRHADDLSRFVRATSRVVTALDEPGRIGDLVDHLAIVAGAVDARSAELAAGIGALERTLAAAPAPLAATEAALPALERAAGHLVPALDVAPAALRAAVGVLDDLDRLTGPGRRARTLRALTTAFRDLPATVSRLAATMPASQPLTDCLSSHIVPLMESVVPADDGAEERPVWQDFAHLLVGLAGASQNFDGNGHNLRYQLGLGENSLSTVAVPGFGTLLANAPATLRSQPLAPADRRPPPVVDDEPCSEQPQPDLRTPSGPADLAPAGGAR